MNTISNAIDPGFFNLVAQVAHTATTYAICFTLATKWGWKGCGVGALGCFIYAVVHEFWYDAYYENDATRGNDWEDFAFLCLGIGLAALVHWL